MRNLIVALVTVVGLFLASCASSGAKEQEATAMEPKAMEAPEKAPMMDETPTIVGVAAGNENFTTLVAAVKAAGLVDVLNGEGPFTVFAPVNSAFEKLPAGTVESLLKPENKAMLTSILTYHVVAGKFNAADVLAAIQKGNGSFAIPTVQKGTLLVSLNDGKVVLTDEKGQSSTVVMADVAASNGVIHAIDSVVMPK